MGQDQGMGEVHAAAAPLDEQMLASSTEERVDEMLRRLHARDYLATLALAESLLFTVPGHGLAKVCRREALGALEPVMSGALTRVARPAGPLSPSAEALLAAADERATVATLLSAGADRPKLLCALHELIRVGVATSRRRADGPT